MQTRSLSRRASLASAIALVVALCPALAAAQTPRLLAELSEDGGVSSSPHDFVDGGTFVWFTATDETGQIGLYVTDGTAANTTRLRTFADLPGCHHPWHARGHDRGRCQRGNRQYPDR